MLEALETVMGEKLDDIIGVGGSFKSGDHILQFLNPLAVDLVHQGTPAYRNICIYGVGKNRGQDDGFEACFGRLFILPVIKLVIGFAIGTLRNISAEAPQIIQAQRSEHQAAENKISRCGIVLVPGGAVSGVGMDRQRYFCFLTIAPDLHRDTFAALRHLKRQSCRKAIALIEDGAIAGDVEGTYAEQHIIDFEQLGGITNRQQAIHTSSQVVIRQFEQPPVSGILKLHHAKSGIGNAVVMLVLNILEEMLNDGRGNEETGVFQAGYSLKSDADDSVVLDDRSAAIARINRRIGLNAQQTPIANMRISLQLDARDHTARVGDFFAAGGITVGDDRRAYLGQLSQI